MEKNYISIFVKKKMITEINCIVDNLRIVLNKY